MNSSLQQLLLELEAVDGVGDALLLRHRPPLAPHLVALRPHLRLLLFQPVLHDPSENFKITISTFQNIQMFKEITINVHSSRLSP